MQILEMLSAIKQNSRENIKLAEINIILSWFIW